MIALDGWKLWNGLDRRGFVRMYCWVGLFQSFTGGLKITFPFSCFYCRRSVSPSCQSFGDRRDHSNKTKNHDVRRCWCHCPSTTPCFFVIMLPPLLTHDDNNRLIDVFSMILPSTSTSTSTIVTISTQDDVLRRW